MSCRAVIREQPPAPESVKNLEAAPYLSQSLYRFWMLRAPMADWMFLTCSLSLCWCRPEQYLVLFPADLLCHENHDREPLRPVSVSLPPLPDDDGALLASPPPRPLFSQQPIASGEPRPPARRRPRLRPSNWGLRLIAGCVRSVIVSGSSCSAVQRHCLQFWIQYPCCPRLVPGWLSPLR